MASAPSTRVHTQQPDKPYPKIDYAFPDLKTAFPTMTNELLLASASNHNPLDIDHPPIWVMRQAGRYLPEFHEIRAHHSFFTVCRTPELACELTLQPIRRYSGLLDASIIFSDILVVPQAMGFEVQMLGGVGPHFPQPLTSPQDAQNRILSRHTDVFEQLKYVFAAITMTRKRLNGQVPLIGFSAAPWTLFTYMVEGGGSKTWEKSKKWIYQHPDNAKLVLNKIAHVCAEYLVGQVQAGAQLLQIFDTNADCLTPQGFDEFILYYLRLLPPLIRSRLLELSIPCPPMTVFAKGANSASQLAALSTSGYDTVGLDWHVTPRFAREATAGRVCLQGNLDPSVLLAGKQAIKREVRQLVWGEDGFLTCAKEGMTGGWIVNLGHGITPGVDAVDGMGYFLQRVRAECRKKKAEDEDEEPEDEEALRKQVAGFPAEIPELRG
ncbi:Uroporphyrinogen decarboxylase in heme biosynthesis [Microbotryomycetes sp. JL221]|nr:Uroporphyrinogen decarboxylase in heme biosynthesis [Microbotryomycetes sp. JL221]